MRKRLVIHNHLPARRAADVSPHSATPTPEQEAEIRALAKGGQSIEKIHAAIGFSLPTLRHIISGRRNTDAKFREGQSVKVTKASSNFKDKVGKVASVDSQGTVYVDFPGGGSGTFSESELTVAGAKDVFINHLSRRTNDWTPGPQAGERVIRRSGQSVIFESKSGGYGVFAPEWGTYYTDSLSDAGKHYSKTLSPRVKKPVQSHPELYTASDTRASAPARAAKLTKLRGTTADHSYRVSQVIGEETGSTYEIWEGAGVDGGSWFVRQRGKTVYRAKSRREAEEHAENS